MIILTLLYFGTGGGSLFNPGYAGIYSVDHLTSNSEIHLVSASQELGLKAWTTTPALILFIGTKTEYWKEAFVFLSL